MNISKLTEQAKASGFKGFCSEFKSQYNAMTPKGKMIFWGVVAGIILILVSLGSTSSELEKSDYDANSDVKKAINEANKVVGDELKASSKKLREGLDDLKKGTDDLKKGMDGLKSLSF